MSRTLTSISTEYLLQKKRKRPLFGIDWSTHKWTALLVVVVLAILAFWQAAVSWWQLLPASFLPPPTAVGEAFGELLARDTFWEAISFSLVNMLIGVAIAVVVGVSVGLAVGWFPLLRLSVAPFIWLLYTTPKVALAPVIILVFGLGVESKVVLVFLLAVFPILLNTLEGVETVSPSLINASRVFGVNGVALGRKVILPSTFPFILAGLQRGAVLGFTGEILGEFLGGSRGIGHILQISVYDYSLDLALAVVLVTIIVANALLITINVMRRVLAPWSKDDTQHAA